MPYKNYNTWMWFWVFRMVHSPRHCAPSFMSKLLIHSSMVNFETIYKALGPDNSIPKYSWIKFCTALWRLSAYNLVGPFLKVMSSIFTIGYSYSMAGSAWRRRCGGSCHCMTACACISCYSPCNFRKDPALLLFSQKIASFLLTEKKGYCAILRIGIAKLHALTASYTSATWRAAGAIS